MTVLHMWLGLVLVLTALSPAPFRFDSLTVPVNRLPRGCHLAPVPTSSTGKPQVVAYPNLTENPWIGGHSETEKLRDASAPTRVERVRQVIDGPPYSTGSVHNARLAEEVVGAYRALYVAADGMKVDVYAIQFTDPKLAGKAGLRPLKDGVRVVVRGTLVVRILGGVGGSCFQAVTDHMTSLKAPDMD